MHVFSLLSEIIDAVFWISFFEYRCLFVFLRKTKTAKVYACLFFSNVIIMNNRLYKNNNANQA